MTAFRHTARTLRADYLRCAAGLAMTAGPIAALPVANGFAWPLGIAAAAFVAYGIQIAINHASPIAMDDTGIARRGPLPRRIAWAELRSLRLKYFSTRRDRRGGWMQLVLKGRQDSIRIESTLNGFEDIVRRAATAARIAMKPE